MVVAEKGSLVRDPEAFLGAVSLPLFRDRQLAELRACYGNSLTKVTPLHLWIYGGAGTGKTTCVRYVLETELEDADVVPVYVNCRQRFTFLDMVDQILNVRRPDVRDPQRTRERQIALLRSCLGDRRCLIALDAIDTLRLADIADLLQHLCSVRTVSLVCVATTCVPLRQLPEPVLSRFSPRRIHFPRYGTDELLPILTRCAQEALVPGRWERKALETAARHAGGDARRALALLRHAVQRAEGASASMLLDEHFVPANFDYFDPRVEDELRLLSSHHQLLYDLLSESGELAGAELEVSYRNMCARQGLSPVSSRTVHRYLEVLCLKRILHRERGARTGGWIYRVATKA